MEIEKNLAGQELVLKISGRIDTNTAPTLEKSINEDVSDATSVVLDFTGVEYISSAGLRVLLSTQKTVSKKGKLVLKNVNADVKDVLDITGFSDILTIE